MPFGAEDGELPHARPWPEPITMLQYERYTPEKLELVEGYLIDGPEATEARERLLALCSRMSGWKPQ